MKRIELTTVADKCARANDSALLEVIAFGNEPPSTFAGVKPKHAKEELRRRFRALHGISNGALRRSELWQTIFRITYGVDAI